MRRQRICGIKCQSCLMGLLGTLLGTRNIRSCSSYQYMRGRRLREISRDL